MKKILRLTPLSLLAPITPNDNDFANDISKEFILPLEELTWLIMDIRDTLNEWPQELKEIFAETYKEHYAKLFAPEVELKEIRISTNKGVVKFNPDDQLFRYFVTPVNKIKWNIESQKNEDRKHIASMVNHSAFYKTDIYFAQTDMSQNNKMIAIGMFMAYFKFYLREPVMSKVEWSLAFYRGEASGRSWENYLVSRVKTIYKTFLSEYNS